VAHPFVRIPKAVWQATLDLVFPPKCVSCGTAGDIWCPACDQSLQRLSGAMCTWCGRPVETGHLCAACQRQPSPLRVRSYARYKPPLVSAILMLKYQPNRQLARRMAGWLAELLERAAWRAEMVVPVPLAPDRLRRRGYNQAGLIAAELAELLHLPPAPEALVRARETRTQVGLAPEERWRNVRGAFLADPALAKGRLILLVDDLYTTGATLSACAEALYEAGGGEVFGLTVGRAG
jgi:competence protein ComFC